MLCKNNIVSRIFAGKKSPSNQGIHLGLPLFCENIRKQTDLNASGKHENEGHPSIIAFYLQSNVKLN